jgi:hypothetical protein
MHGFAMKPRVLVAIESDRVLPNWAITHYLQQTEVNYLRLVTTQEICAYAARGHDLGRLVAATESAEIFPRERISLAVFKGRVALGESPEMAERFWKIIGRHSRPMVFVAEGDSDACLPLYDYLEAEALVVRRLETHSPFNASLEGMASALPDLIYAREREQRARDAWRNEQIGQAARNIRDIASASEIINSANAPSGLQAYASHMLGQLLENQQRLNEAAGITVHRIDQVA